MQPTDSVNVLKWNIYSNLGVPPDHQNLFVDAHTVDSGSLAKNYIVNGSLADNGIKNGGNLVLEVCTSKLLFMKPPTPAYSSGGSAVGMPTTSPRSSQLPSLHELCRIGDAAALQCTRAPSSSAHLIPQKFNFDLLYRLNSVHC